MCLNTTLEASDDQNYNIEYAEISTMLQQSALHDFQTPPPSPSFTYFIAINSIYRLFGTVKPLPLNGSHKGVIVGTYMHTR